MMRQNLELLTIAILVHIWIKLKLSLLVEFAIHIQNMSNHQF